jgi:hypothetical protein
MPISIGFVDAAVFVRLAQSCSIRAETRIQVRKDSHRPGILAETVGFELYATTRQHVPTAPEARKIKAFRFTWDTFGYPDSVRLWANRGQVKSFSRASERGLRSPLPAAVKSSEAQLGCPPVRLLVAGEA